MTWYDVTDGRQRIGDDFALAQYMQDLMALDGDKALEEAFEAWIDEQWTTYEMLMQCSFQHMDYLSALLIWVIESCVPDEARDAWGASHGFEWVDEENRG